MQNRTGLLVIIALATAVGFRAGTAQTTNAADTASARVASSTPTSVSMRNVDFHVGEGVVLRIRHLQGEMHSLKRGVIDFDDKTSYETFVDTAEVGLGGPDLANLLNRYVFAYRGAPLKHLKVEIGGRQLRLAGTLHKGVDIPFVISASVSLTPEAQIRLHPTRTRIFGVDGAKLLSALGLNLQKMLDLSNAKGVVVHGNDFFLAPLVVLPGPAIRGRILDAQIVGDRLVQVFGRSDSSARAAHTATHLPDSTARNYMLYRGGTLHFGKLFMTDAEMLIVDRDTSDPFDFDNDHYQRQLIAGYSRTLSDLGLEVYMPDASKLSGATSSPVLFRGR